MAVDIKIVEHLKATADYLRRTPSNVDIMGSRFFDADFRTEHGQPLTHQIFLSPAIRSLLNQHALDVVKKIKANNLSAFKDDSIETSMNQIRQALLAEIRGLFLNKDGTIKQEYIDAFAYSVDGKMVSGEEAIRTQFAPIIVSAESLPNISNEEEFLKKFGYCLANSYFAHCEQYLSECVSKEVGANSEHSNALEVWHIKGAQQRSALIDKFGQSAKRVPQRQSSVASLSSRGDLQPKSSSRRPKASTAPDLRVPKKHPWFGYTCERMPAGKVEELKPKTMYIKQMMTGGLVCYYMKEGQRVAIKVSKENMSQFSARTRAQLEVMAKEGNVNTIESSNLISRFIENIRSSSFDSAVFLDELSVLESGLMHSAAVHYEETVFEDGNKADGLANNVEPYDPKTLMPSFKHNFRRVGRNFFKTAGHEPTSQSINNEIQAVCDEVQENASLFDIFERAIIEKDLASLNMAVLSQLKEKLEILSLKIEALNTKKRPEYGNKPLDWALFESSIDNLRRLNIIVCEEMKRRLSQPDLKPDQIEALLNRTEEEFIPSSISGYAQEMADRDRKEIFDFLSHLCSTQFISKRQHLFMLSLLSEDSFFEEQFWKILQGKHINDVEAVIFQFIISLNHTPNIIELQKNHITRLAGGSLSEADFIRGCAYLRQEEISEQEYLYVCQQWSQGNNIGIEAIITQYREENAALLLPEVGIKKAPVPKRPVALLDIDHTLYFQDKNQKIVLNEQLLENLKQRGIQDIYLFTDMTFRLSAITERMQLVLDLEARGFKVHGIITPADLMLDSVLPEDIEALDQYNRADSSKVERMTERAMEAYQSEQEVPKNEARIGRAFRHCVEKFGPHIKSAVQDKNISDVNARDIIVQDYFNENGLLQDVRAFDNKSKVVVNGWIGPVAQSLGYSHPKGCMLAHFKKHKPDWVGDITVADDLQEVITTVQKMDPAIKTIHITGVEMDEAVYTQALGEKNPNPTEPSVDYSSFIERAPFIRKKLSRISSEEGIPEITLDEEASVAVSREHLKTVIAATNPNPYSEPNPRAFVDPFMPIQGFSVELQLKAREDFIDLYNGMVDFYNDDKNFALYQQNPEEYIMELCVLKQEDEKPTPAVIRQRHHDLFEKMYRYIFDEQGNYTQYFQREYSGKSVDQYLAHCQLSRQDLFLQYVQNYHDTVNELFKQHAVNIDSGFEMLFNAFHTEFFGRDLATAPNSIACDAFFCDKLREQISQDGWLASLDLMALFQLKKEIAVLRGMSLEEKEALIYKIKIEQWKQLLVLKEWANVLPDDSKKTLRMIATEEDEYTYLNDILDFYVEREQEIPGLKELAALFREKRIGTEAFKFILRQFSLNQDFALAMVNAALEGISPLHYAARKNDIKLAQFLLNQGKSPQSSQDDKSRAPLHYAIQQSNMDMAELLVVKGADVNARDFLGKTPLHYAIEQGNLKAIQFLLMKGAEPGIKDNSQRMAFHYAMGRKDKAIIDLLVNFVAKDYKTSLHYAVLEGDVELARHLIEQGAVMDSEDTEGKTPLHYAVINGNIQLAQYLIQQGADVDFKDNDGKGPLHYAVEKNNEKLISLLIDGGANIEAQDKDGNTPLHDAAKKDNEKIFYLLFNRSVQFKSASIKRAAEALSAENAKEKSAYISQRLALIPVNIPVVQNNEGKTPLDCAGGKIRRMESGRTLIRNYNQFLDEFSSDIQNFPPVFETLMQRFKENMLRVRNIMPSDQDSQELLERCLDLSSGLPYDSSYYKDCASHKDHALRYGEALLLESLVEALSIRASDDFKKMPQYQYLLKMLALKKEMSTDAAQNKSVTRRKALLEKMVNFDRTVRDSSLSVRDQNEAYESVNTKFKAPALSSERTEIRPKPFVGKRIAGAFMMALGSMMRMSSIGVSAMSYGEKLVKESQEDYAKAKIQKASVDLLESAYHIKTEALSSVTGTVAEKCTTVGSKISVVWEDTPSNMKAVTSARSEDSGRLAHGERIEDLGTEEMLRPEHSMDLAEHRKSEDFIGAGSSLDQGYRLRAMSGGKGKGKGKEKADDKTIYFEVVNGRLEYSIMLAPEEWFGGTLVIAIDENDLNDDFLQGNKNRILEMIENHMTQLHSTPPSSPEQKRSQSRETVQAAINREPMVPSPALSLTSMLPLDSPLCSGGKISSSLEPNPRSNFSDESGPASSHRFKTPGTKG